MPAAKLPAYGRELLSARRFGGRRPNNNRVVITDNWDLAKLCREWIGWPALVIEPFVPPDLTACYDLDAVVVMDGDTRLARRALRRARPRSAAYVSMSDCLDVMEACARKWYPERSKIA